MPKRIGKAVRKLLAAIETSDDVMDGAPVFKGTRVLIDVVIASLDQGIPFARVQKSYEFLTPELVSSARAFQRVHGTWRTRRIAEVHPEWQELERAKLTWPIDPFGPPQEW